MTAEEYLAQQYLRFESKEITWVEFLQNIIQKFSELGEEVEHYEEFLEVMTTTSYPDEKQSYQTVEIHYEYAEVIDGLRKKQ